MINGSKTLKIQHFEVWRVHKNILLCANACMLIFSRATPDIMSWVWVNTHVWMRVYCFTTHNPLCLVIKCVFYSRFCHGLARESAALKELVKSAHPYQLQHSRLLCDTRSVTTQRGLLGYERGGAPQRIQIFTRSDFMTETANSQQNSSSEKSSRLKRQLSKLEYAIFCLKMNRLYLDKLYNTLSFLYNL